MRPLRQLDLPQSGLTQPVTAARRLTNDWPRKTRPDWPWIVGHSAVAWMHRSPWEETVRQVTFEPARPLDTGSMPWIPTGPGKSFRPLRFAADGWSELMRLEPGSAVALHRHTGEVHAFNISGTREILGSGELVGPGGYGDEPCVVHIKVTGTIEYLDSNGQVIEFVSAETQRAVYLAWCRAHDVRPSD